MKIFNNLTHHHTICLKLGNRFFTSLIILGFECKAIICSTIEEKLAFYCQMFSALVVTVVN